jgi:hypothetical protein
MDPHLRTSSDSELARAREALESARATRDCYRRRPAADLERREALDAATVSLRECWTPGLQRQARSGRRYARTLSDEPVHVVARERRAELARLRSMLNPTTGTVRERPAVTAEQMIGYSSRARQDLSALGTLHEDARRHHGRGTLRARKGGSYFTSMGDLNAEARSLLGDLAAIRRTLSVQHRRFEMTAAYAPRDPRKPYAGQDEARKVENHLQETYEDFIEPLLEALRADAKRTEPLPWSEVGRRRERPGAWTRERIERTLASYVADTGRLPTARELHANPTLPHYTTLRRLYGPRPFQQIATVVERVRLFDQKGGANT